MKKGVKFDFTKTKREMAWIAILKSVFNLSLKDAKNAVECGEYFVKIIQFKYKNDAIEFYDDFKSEIIEIIGEIEYNLVVKFIWEDEETQEIQETNSNIVKVGSVYIITEEEYESLKKSKDELKKQTNMLNDIQGILNKMLIKHE